MDADEGGPHSPPKRSGDLKDSMKQLVTDYISSMAPEDFVQFIEHEELHEVVYHAITNGPLVEHGDRVFGPPESYPQRPPSDPFFSSVSNANLKFHSEFSGNWDNLNKREQYILFYIKNKKKTDNKFCTDNFVSINDSWEDSLGKVTQSRFSQIISSLIKNEWLHQVGSRGSGSSRILIIPHNVADRISSIPVEHNDNKRSKNAYKRWTDGNPNDENRLRLLHHKGNTPAELARELKRSESAVLSRISFLKLQSVLRPPTVKIKTPKISDN